MQPTCGSLAKITSCADASCVNMWDGHRWSIHMHLTCSLTWKRTWLKFRVYSFHYAIKIAQSCPLSLFCPESIVFISVIIFQTPCECVTKSCLIATFQQKCPTQSPQAKTGPDLHHGHLHHANEVAEIDMPLFICWNSYPVFLMGPIFWLFSEFISRLVRPNLCYIDMRTRSVGTKEVIEIKHSEMALHHYI